jgi:aminoglycoside/choline kinase family phosphotransferase
LVREGFLLSVDEQTFFRWFDYMGLQRGLKCIGIFARLKERDQKSHYLQYIPRVIRYVEQVCAQYPELAPLTCLLKKGFL